MADIKLKLIGGCVLVVVAVIIGLIASSLSKLSTEDAALQYDVHQRVLKERVYRAGLHAGPPGFKFIIFPNVYRTISFGGINCLNKDGLEIELSVQFQYLPSVKDGNLRKLIMQYENHDKYLNVVLDTAEEVIHDTCSTFNVTQFQTSRVQFQDDLFNALGSRLGHEFKTDVRDVQVSNIQRPAAYEQVMIDKESAKQNINVALQERPRVLTAANTELKESETQANITLNKARTDARIAITKASATAKAILNAYTTEADTYKTIKEKQSLTINGLLSYLTTRAIQSVERPIYINLDAPAKI